MARLFFKDETQNPTWSFKDRGTLLGLQHAAALGYTRIGTVSTGNMAVSVAAYGARGNFSTVILVNDQIPPEKIGPIAIYDVPIIMVEGDYGALYRRSIELGREEGIYFINSDAPLCVEGSKSIAFEIAEQMAFDIPEHVVVPTSAGGNLRGIIKGFVEFRDAGLISEVPHFVCAQAAGCSPIVKAADRGWEYVEPEPEPHTIAHAIENPDPPSGNEVLRRMRQLNGSFVAVSDEEILDAQRWLAREGVFGQPAAGVPLAACRRLLEGGIIGEDDTVVCVVTGAGLKYTLVLEQHPARVHHTDLETLGAVLAGL
jgi:threonine synthase